MGLSLVFGFTVGALIFGWVFWGLGSISIRFPNFTNFIETYKNKRSKKKLKSLWPSLIINLIGSLRAGLPLSQALDQMLKEAPTWAIPSLLSVQGPDFPFLTDSEKAKRLFYDPRLNLVQSAIIISSKTGGRLPDLLEKAVAQVHESIILENKKETHLAEGRATALVVSGFPFLILMGLSLISPQMIEPIIKTPMGWGILSVSLFLQGIGFWVIRRILDF